LSIVLPLDFCSTDYFTAAICKQIYLKSSMFDPFLSPSFRSLRVFRYHVAPFALGSTAIALLTLSGCAGMRNSLATVLGKSEASKPEPVPSAQLIKSSPAQLALINHLNSVGAKLYATYWCPYCMRQQELFGEAARKLQIVECDPNGKNAQPAACTSANVSSYPTWEINGKQYPGMRSLDELALLSGYKGSLDFTR
jgi:glutaredoxin